MATNLPARPSIELVRVGAIVTKKAEQQIESCEYCHPDDAEIPFDWILAEVTGKRGPYEFIVSDPARCPNCEHPVTEKTLATKCRFANHSFDAYLMLLIFCNNEIEALKRTLTSRNPFLRKFSMDV